MPRTHSSGLLTTKLRIIHAEPSAERIDTARMMALRRWSSSTEPTAERTGADEAMDKAKGGFEHSSKAVRSDEMLLMLVTERCFCIRCPPY